MSPFTRILRFSDAVYAVGATPKTIRNWLQRDQVDLFGESSDGWHSFSVADIVLLALIHRFVRFGFTVDEANGLVVGFMLSRLPRTKNLNQMPMSAFEVAFRGFQLVTVHGENGPKYYTLFDETIRQFHEGTTETFDAYLVLNAGHIVSETIKRIHEIAGEPGGGPSE